ncbi:hypothetical protein CHUAL_003201 [Chamberlinius hualienensis]
MTDANCDYCLHLLESEIDARDDLEGVIRVDLKESPEVLKQAVIENVRWQMVNNRKTTVLKKLQGLMYPDGFKSGKLSGHVYDDVKPNLEKWKNDGKKIYIYSSGSVQAQKLLYGYSKYGDLTKLLDGYFDTLVGPKIVKDSYLSISQEINLNPKEILFFTDVGAESTAAAEAGLQVCLVSRPGNAKLDDEITETFPIINSFDCLDIL